ncbi:MAG: hypothetical protein JWM76_366 [Pseudonocardiales bacterium]|nr:hypothetical protein [Pseudonocardiales bacterium]
MCGFCRLVDCGNELAGVDVSEPSHQLDIMRLGAERLVPDEHTVQRHSAAKKLTIHWRGVGTEEEASRVWIFENVVGRVIVVSVGTVFASLFLRLYGDPTRNPFKVGDYGRRDFDFGIDFASET